MGAGKEFEAASRFRSSMTGSLSGDKSANDTDGKCISATVEVASDSIKLFVPPSNTRETTPAPYTGASRYKDVRQVPAWPSANHMDGVCDEHSATGSHTSAEARTHFPVPIPAIISPSGQQCCGYQAQPEIQRRLLPSVG